MRKRRIIEDEFLENSGIAELLATEAETSKQPLQKALRRASRRGFLWPQEATQLVREQRSLEELSGVGPYLNKIIRGWIEHPPEAAAARGYEYIAVIDHSKGLKIAGGSNEEQLRQQAAEIASANDVSKRAGRRVRVLQSVELNLDPQGGGDMD